MAASPSPLPHPDSQVPTENPGNQLAAYNPGTHALTHPVSVPNPARATPAKRDIVSVEDIIVYIRRYWRFSVLMATLLAVPVVILMMGRTPFYRSDAALRVLMVADQSLPFARKDMPENSAVFFVRNHKVGLTSRAYQEYFYDRFDPRLREEYLEERGYKKPLVAQGIAWIKGLKVTVSGLFQKEPATGNPADREREKFLKRLNLQTIGVTEVKDSHILSVEAKGPNRELTARIANEYAGLYADYIAHREREEARQSYLFLKQREEGCRGVARESRLALNRFRIENDVLDTTGFSAADEIKRLQEQRATVRVDYTRADAALRQADEMRASGGDLLAIKEITKVANVQAHYTELLKQQQQHRTHISLYGDSHRLVKQAEEQIRAVEVSLAAEVENTLRQFAATRASAVQKLAALDAELQKVLSRDLTQEDKAIELASLVAQAESDQKTHDQILEKLNQVKVEMEIPRTSQVTIADKAVPAELPFRPNMPLVLLLGGMLFGSVLVGLPLVLGLGEEMSRRFKVNLPFVHRVIPVELGRLGHVSGATNINMLAEAFAPGATRDSLFKLAFEIERSGNGSHRSILVTSAAEGEGKSFLAAALGGVYCSQGKKTLVIDCNLRSPSMSLWFPHLQGGTNLVEWLQAPGEKDYEVDYQRHGISELYVLTSRGWATNPEELLSHPCFEQLLEKMEGIFDLVIVDGPHVNGIDDAALIGKNVKDILMVSDARISGWKELHHACSGLQREGGNVIGVVSNRNA